MDVVAFILMIIAAVIFFFVPDSYWARYQRTSVALGLFFLTVGLICQFTHISGHNIVNS